MAFIKTDQGDFIASDQITRIQRIGSDISIWFSDGVPPKVYHYPSDTDAILAMNGYDSILTPVPLGEPVILGITPSYVLIGALPVSAVITGANFSLTSAISASAEYGPPSSTALTTTYVSPTVLLVVLDVALGVNTYQLDYSDSEGGTASLDYALVID